MTKLGDKLVDHFLNNQYVWIRMGKGEAYHMRKGAYAFECSRDKLMIKRQPKPNALPDSVVVTGTKVEEMFSAIEETYQRKLEQTQELFLSEALEELES